jgi:superfamily I DNA/RNA helicase
MSRVAPDQWKPVGIDWMEPEAWRSVQSDYNVMVLAGPGSGKSELLAQRASFLLQTGDCVSPKQILAISFKRDAAGNLRDRVSERCKPEEVARFSSLTFDSFTKDILDRFKALLPDPWILGDRYEIDFLDNSRIAKFLRDTARDAPREWQNEIRNFNPKTFECTIASWRTFRY